MSGQRRTKRTQLSRPLFAGVLGAALLAASAPLRAQLPATGPLRDGKLALAAKDFAHAKTIFAEYVRAHPDSIDGRLGEADAELGLHEYEAAELEYRRVVAAQPELWLAHKNLVIVEGSLGRWNEFDRERALLRGARDRGAPGISTRESDVIDNLDVRGQHWIVREYYEPAGRSLTRYNFERFSPEGRVQGYISLESADAAKAALAGGDVHIGTAQSTQERATDFALNWYTGTAHGTIASYPQGEPSYERVRADALRWLRRAK